MIFQITQTPPATCSKHFNDFCEVGLVFLPVTGSKIKCKAKATPWHLMVRRASSRLCCSSRFMRMKKHPEPSEKHQISSTAIIQSRSLHRNERTDTMIRQPATPPDGFHWSLKAQRSGSPPSGSLPLLSVPHWLETGQSDECVITGAIYIVF